jgi:hypothetical protein
MKVNDEKGYGLEDDIFDDSVLQTLSILCPTGMMASSHARLSYPNLFFVDYNAFKEVLTTSLDQDVPDIEELVKLKWEKYGQKFLQLCINHKTGIRFFPPFIILLTLMIVLVPSPRLNRSAQQHYTINTTINRRHPSQKSRRHKLLPALNSNLLDLFVYRYSDSLGPLTY